MPAICLDEKLGDDMEDFPPEEELDSPHAQITAANTNQLKPRPQELIRPKGSKSPQNAAESKARAYQSQEL
jgi:hypothetical protein